MAKAQKIDGGGKCPKCKRNMQRRSHKGSWTPKLNQPYYFSHWDKCRCGRLQHYEEAKVFLAWDGPKWSVVPRPA